MKPDELMKVVDALAGLSPAEILVHPAWTYPVRLGSNTAALRTDGRLPADPVTLRVRFGTENALLAFSPCAAMPEFSKLAAVRSAIPETILMAVIEKEAGSLLQMLENAVRQELSIDGLSESAPTDAIGFRLVADGREIVSFALTATPALVAAFGDLRYLDASHPTIADAPLACETEYAAFDLSDDERAQLAPGDFLLLPEFAEELPGRLVLAAETRPASCRVLAAEPTTVRFADFLAADGNLRVKKAGVGLRLVREGRVLATGSLSRLGEQPAFAIEAVL